MLHKAFITCALWLFGVQLAHAAPDILLAKDLPAQVQVRDYLVSEKYDGVRAYWDDGVLRFRGGGVVNAPRWFIDGLPKQALDGELWIARGAFDQTSAIVRSSTPVDADWQQIKYMIFELPHAAGSFAERAAHIERITQAAAQSHLVAVKQYRLNNRAELQRDLDKVVQAGGEGLMLHLASALYVTGRSDVLYKLKPQHDAEAVVIAHIKGQGKYTDMLGALRVRTDDDREFNIGTGFTDEVRRNPPAVGAVVTYRYRGLTRNGLPRFASFWRVRR